MRASPAVKRPETFTQAAGHSDHDELFPAQQDQGELDDFLLNGQDEFFRASSTDKNSAHVAPVPASLPKLGRGLNLPELQSSQGTPSNIQKEDSPSAALGKRHSLNFIEITPSEL